MRQRVTSALVGLVLLGVALAAIGTRLYNIITAALALIALYEVLRATGCLKNRGLTVLSFIMAITITFSREYLVRIWTIQLIFVFFIAFFTLLIKNSSTTRVEQTAMAFMFSIFIPLFFSCSVFLRDIYGPVAGAFYLLMALGSAFLCDTGAYFTGRKLGRHKLAPAVSPNKTVEGAIGGLLFSMVFMPALAAVFRLVLARLGVAVEIDYALLMLLTPVCSVLGMLGDLSASVIKRQFDVKDYGTIMPGHGGVMDRFDSVLFTMPSVFIIAHHAQIITVL